MPKLGQTVEESTIVKWHKQVGDPVAKGDVLFEIETDKAVLEVESFFDGTLLAIVVKEGETVPVTAPVAFVGEPGEKIPAVTPPAAKPKPAPAAPAPAPGAPAPAAAASTEAVAATPAAVTPAVAPPPQPQRRAFSPRARRLLKETPIDPAAVPSSGARVTEKDVLAYLETSGYRKLRLTPAARELALREKINVLEVEADTDGRIGVTEIQTAIAEKPRPLSTMRQVIARRMLQSTTGIPHFYVTVPVDVTDLLEWRKELKQAGMNYSVTDFIIKAVALVLREFPVVNSATDGKTISRRTRINIGMAVSLPDGLVVPVIRGADHLDLPQLHARIVELAGRARDGKLAPDDMTGGTFTVSNMGMLDVENFTAIINPGESGILAVSSVRPQPAVYEGAIVVRSLMKITLSSDHRVVDGAMAAQFVNKIRSRIEDLEAWKNMI
jgi:pyruvate dehydrogenase E2 component (dihydrolipoamide acetyltransferase)